MKKQVLDLLFAISLRSRILREWQKTSQIRDDHFSEREILTLELIRDYSPITEKALTKFFGLSFSSVADILTHLRELDLVEQPEKSRGKPLKLTKTGIRQIDELRNASAARYGYLLDGLSEKEVESLAALYAKMDRNAERHVQKLVFGIET
jgi:Mn-dependent DtxR family transcriptional regulator